MLVLRADRHRDLRAQLQALGADPARLQPAPQRARHHREDDIVDRAAEGVLDLLVLREIPTHPAKAPVRSNLVVQGHRGGWVGKGPAELTQALDGLGQAAYRRPRSLDRVLRAARNSRRE